MHKNYKHAWKEGYDDRKIRNKYRNPFGKSTIEYQYYDAGWELLPWSDDE